MKIGLNLYSLRDYVKAGEKIFTETLVKLKNMGYDYMQFSGAPIDAEMIARASKNSGLPFVLTHALVNDILFDTDNLMEKHAKFGCKNIGLSMMPTDTMKNLDLAKKIVDKLNLVGEKMQKAGYKFCYHHHHFEFYKINGETIFDYMLNFAPYFNFTVDTYWLQYSGLDILTMLERLRGRIECIHLKDYQIDEDDNGLVGFAPRFAPVGNGNIDFPSVIGKARDCSTKYFFVEQDDAISYPNPLDQVKMSINYLRKLEL